MKFSTFQATGDQVSRIGFGAMGLGGAFGSFDESELIRSVLHSLERGVTFIDTARAYGDSERLVGKALAQWHGERPFLATKIQSKYPGSVGWGRPVPVEEAFPPGWIRASTERSLRELGVDCVDLMQLHQYWPQWDRADYWLEELGRLKEEGKIRSIGVSIPDQRHDIALSIVQIGKIDAVQTVFNIFDPLPLDCLIPFCEENRVAFLARCVMDEGGLTGFLTADMTFGDDDYRKSYFDYVPREMYIERVDRLRKFVPQYADSLAELAIRFVLRHPGVTTALVSMHVPAHADQNIVSAGKEPLPDDVFEELYKYHRWVRNFYDTKFW
ncbi:aldo/keto reductase [Cohnella sp. GbtcB17]|uniref:aldo/keto reductase n=1 Tax=Cohnella sp. GbtcB17 TaxID=2824762 RepID=UPI001C30B5AD|nr:aldo/keto reductase [Cohnella sp. GbtcB17]